MDEFSEDGPRSLTAKCTSDEEEETSSSFDGNDKAEIQRSGNDLEKLLSELSYPFCDASKTNFDLVLTPACGTFLDDFNNRTGLHIGVTSEGGEILEFDHNGVKCGRSEDKRWRQCLRLNFIDRLTEEASVKKTLELRWKKTVQQLSKSGEARWSKEGYHPDHNNCFDFVIEFIKILLKQLEAIYPNLSMLEGNQDKVIFCESFVIPVTKGAARYMSLYRTLAADSKSTPSARANVEFD